MLTKEEIQEFKKLVKKIYGRNLTDAEAEDQGSRLITAFELIIKNKQKKTNLQKLFIATMREIKKQESKDLASDIK